MSGCPAMPGQRRCPPWRCDCFIDMYPDDPTAPHPEAFIVGKFPPTDPNANADEARDWRGEWERDVRMDDA